jgi:catechol-2,3-dioxygenase
MKNISMTLRSLLIFAAAMFVVFAAAPADAQLAPPNSSGVTMGHIHLFVKDVEAQKKFWTATMGGTVVQTGR